MYLCPLRKFLNRGLIRRESHILDDILLLYVPLSQFFVAVSTNLNVICQPFHLSYITVSRRPYRLSEFYSNMTTLVSRPFVVRE